MSEIKYSVPNDPASWEVGCCGEELPFSFASHADAKEAAKWLNEHLAALQKDAERYRWIREHGAWETEAFLNGLSAEEYDAAVDEAMSAVLPSWKAEP